MTSSWSRRRRASTAQSSSPSALSCRARFPTLAISRDASRQLDVVLDQTGRDGKEAMAALFGRSDARLTDVASGVGRQHETDRDERRH
jgi:predicted fused transcriptional regulator/phosphomethylpyrimidine kinase